MNDNIHWFVVVVLNTFKEQGQIMLVEEMLPTFIEISALTVLEMSFSLRKILILPKIMIIY